MTTQEPRDHLSKAESLFLWLCICADFGFIVLHILYKLELLDSSYFSVKRDLGYSEFFQYTKFLWIIILLIHIIRKTKVLEYLAWVAVFAYFLADDSFQIHENIGGSIADNLDFVAPFNLRLQDIGELAVFGIAGMILLALLAWAYWRGTQTFRNISKDLLILVVIMAFFGIVIDAAEIGVDLGLFIKETLGLIDDGGEMIVVSVMLWYIFRLAVHNGHIDKFLYTRLPGLSKQTAK
ncbi:MAG TPA: hypothetical protein PLF42_09215 [Anaerolineales bacterium]|nr:hypothetical protein [Anaerolineales bacterium]